MTLTIPIDAPSQWRTLVVSLVRAVRGPGEVPCTPSSFRSGGLFENRTPTADTARVGATSARLVLADSGRGRRSDAVRGVEENLLQRARQVPAPHHGRRRSQRGSGFLVLPGRLYGDGFVEPTSYVRRYPGELPAPSELLPQVATPATIINGGTIGSCHGRTPNVSMSARPRPRWTGDWTSIHHWLDKSRELRR